MGGDRPGGRANGPKRLPGNKKVSGPKTLRFSLTVSLPSGLRDRLAYLRDLIGMADVESVIVQAVRLYDRMACATVVEGAAVRIQNRDGTTERIDVVRT